MQARTKGSAASLAALLFLMPVQAASPKRPAIPSIEASPSLLWPPNHRMVPVTVSVAADGNGCAIVGVASDDTGSKKKNDPDWVITGPLTVDLRAERSGSSDGRHYTISVECSGAGASTVVTVPHDRGKGRR